MAGPGLLWTRVKKGEGIMTPSAIALGLLSPILGITKEIMSRGPQVLDMECREPDDLSMVPEGPSFLQCSPHITSSSIHHTGLVLKWQWVLLHEVISLGIMVCIAPIFKTFKHVALNLSGFHNVCLTLCSLPCPNLGGSHGALVNWFPFRIGCYPLSHSL